MLPGLDVVDLGKMPYGAAYARQGVELDRVLAAREAAGEGGAGEAVVGRILLVEHDPPVITVSRRDGARRHLVATERQLAEAGVTVAETDRGGDITYHGPGQLVVYPILDLNRLRLGLHDYMRLLEGAVIDACADFGVAAERDACATGVWVRRNGGAANGHESCGTTDLAKVCAMGVRVRRWITMHGLAINVTTNLEHFGLIVPCGLAGRRVTSLAALLEEVGGRAPSMADAKGAVVARLTERIAAAAARASQIRAEAAGL